ERRSMTCRRPISSRRRATSAGVTRCRASLRKTCRQRSARPSAVGYPPRSRKLRQPSRSIRRCITRGRREGDGRTRRIPSRQIVPWRQANTRASCNLGGGGRYSHHGIVTMRGGGGDRLSEVNPTRAEHSRIVSRLPVSAGVRDLSVGREAELGRLVRALDRAIAGEGRLVFLVGEPGIGKTRIARELATRAGALGVAVRWGR